MTRFLILLTWLASNPAHALPGAACDSGVPGCRDGGTGLIWIPVVILLQVAFLYAVQGQRGILVCQILGKERRLSADAWGLMQLGVPVGLVLSYPVLVGLTLLDKWLGHAGVAEIAAVQGAYWLLALALFGTIPAAAVAQAGCLRTKRSRQRDDAIDHG